MNNPIMEKVEVLILKANKKFKKDSTKWKYLVRKLYILDIKLHMKYLNDCKEAQEKQSVELEADKKRILELIK